MDEIANLKALLAQQAKALAAMDEKVDSVATDIANFTDELAVIQDQVSEAAGKPTGGAELNADSLEGVEAEMQHRLLERALDGMKVLTDDVTEVLEHPDEHVDQVG